MKKGIAFLIVMIMLFQGMFSIGSVYGAGEDITIECDGIIRDENNNIITSLTEKMLVK
mgnify:CR=1 FL=1